MTSDSFALVFLAAAMILFFGNTYAGDLCFDAMYPNMCHRLVKGQTDPTKCTLDVIHRLKARTRRVKEMAAKLPKDQYMDVCNEMLDSAFTSLDSLGILQLHAPRMANSDVSAALTYFVTCEDTFAEAGKPFPFIKDTTIMRQMASVALHLLVQIPEPKV